LAGVALALLPLVVADDFTLFQLGRVASIAIVLLALNLLTGAAGLISVGHGALMGIGAYVTAICVARLELSYTVAIPMAVIVCTAVGAALGLPALRIRGLYLGLVTLALAIALPPVLKRFRDITGGPLGLSPRLPATVLGLGPDQSRYLVAITVAVATFAFVVWLRHSRWGRQFAAVKSSDAMAAATGVPVARTKVTAFAISSGLAGLGGGVFVTVIGTITPDTFTVTLSISLLAAAIVGGINLPAGAFIGALFFVYVPDLTADLGGQIPQIAYAVALLAAIYFLPGGIVTLPGRVFQRLRRIRTSHRDAARPAAPSLTT
jgi:branched-chain amino acid transport system permease protein